jgi:uncharacterized protein
MPSFLSPLLKEPSRSFRLVNLRTGAIVADRLLPAFEPEARRRGLLAYPSMPEGAAMVIAPTNAVHTFFMKFAIDLLFVARDGRVVKVRGDVRPWRMSAAWRGHAVIELEAGALRRTAVNVGDQITMLPNQP